MEVIHHTTAVTGELDSSIFKNISINRGISDDFKAQLVAKSKQPHIEAWTPRDATERFTSLESIEAQVLNGTEFYTLSDQEGKELGGLIWLHPVDGGSTEWTFAVRLYEGFVGNRLAGPFMEYAIHDLALVHPEVTTISLSADRENFKAKHLYEVHGFSTIGSDEERTYMQRDITDNPKVVVIGGGTGSYTVLSGLKHHSNNITAIVGMSDDGGSTGRLRDELGVLPPGDVRQCLVALSESETLRTMFEYRLQGGTSLDGHSLGNLLLSGLQQMTGSFEEAVAQLSSMLAINGKVVPVTTDNTELYAKREDGQIIKGESVIGHMNFGSERPEIYLQPEGSLSAAAKQAIGEAQAVVIAPGNLYGSLAPALVINGMREALKESAATKIYVSNLVTKKDQTVGFQVHDFASEIERFVGAQVLDYVLFNTDEPPASLLSKYTHQGEHMMEFDLDILAGQHYHAVGLPLIATEPVHYSKNDKLASKRTLIRHDYTVLAQEIIKIVRQ